MSDNVQVNYEQLDQIAGRLGAAAAASADLRGMVLRGSAPLAEGGWVGLGAAAFFAELHDELLPALQRLELALGEGGAVTQALVELFHRAEEEAAAPFRGAAPATTPGHGQLEGDGSFWDEFWGSMPGQAGLAVLNFVWGFVAGSGSEIGARHGRGAQVGGFAGDVTSSFMIYGDLRDLTIQGLNKLTGRDVDELTVILSGVGLVGDLGWLAAIVPDPADGVNAGAAVLKGMVKQINALPEPVRRGVTDLIKWGLENPQRLGDVAELVQFTLKHHDTPLGQATLDLFAQGAKNPAWFAKGADAVEFMKADPERFARLATDPDHSGIIYKGIREAEVGLGMERARPGLGLVQGVTRDPRTGAGDLLDGTGQSWDVKAFNSSQPGWFKLNREVTKIETELTKGQNVILDTGDLGPTEIAALRDSFKPHWQGRVKFYPPLP